MLKPYIQDQTLVREKVIEPKKVPPSCGEIIICKGIEIKARIGVYKLKGDPQIINLSYDTGLGSKNSQGFGCWEETNKNRGEK